MAGKTVNITGFGGSLRSGSFNRMLLEEFASLAPDGSFFSIAEIRDIPLYNPDNERESGEAVSRFRNALNDADAILVVTPEYNYSIPGFLKNAIDSVSRPVDSNPFKDKPVAIASCSIGMLGGSRAQYHLRQVMQFLEARTILKPEVFIPYASEKFGVDGKLKDERIRGNMKTLIDKLVAAAGERS